MLYKHQEIAIDRFKDETEIGLFFEMGCGKSLTALKIAENKFQKGEINALLIIAPNDVHAQWANEQVPSWLAIDHQVQCLYGKGGQKTFYPFDEDGSLQVVTVNVDTFSLPSKWQSIVDWANGHKTMIVLDEATSIKNIKAQRTKRILYSFNDVLMRRKTVLKSTVKTAARAVLTGTPVTNGPMDLWAMMEFLKPNYFRMNYYTFQQYFGMFTQKKVKDRLINIPLTADTWQGIKNIKVYDVAAYTFGVSRDTFNTVHAQERYNGPYKHADELKELIKPVSMFVRLVDCVDMPEQRYIVREVEMNDEQWKCYRDMADEYIATYGDKMMTALNKMTVMLRLQQISSGFICDKTFSESQMADGTADIVPTDGVQWIGKTCPKLEALYRDVAEAAKPVIIITRFSAEAARIYYELNKEYRCCLMTGWKRVGTIEEFKDGKYDVMVANSTVISKGFNLQRSHVMLFYSNSFSLETRLQAEGRTFRIGQYDPCIYIDYRNKNSVDEKVWRSLTTKQNLLDFIRGSSLKELVC